MKNILEYNGYAGTIEFSADDLIVSLSTCTNIRQVDRFLVQGVLIDIRPAR